jgi:hypothetical protein
MAKALFNIGDKIIGADATGEAILFKNRVVADGGTLETFNETDALIRKLHEENVYKDVTIGLVAGAYKAGKWYSFKGSDMDVVRATSGTRINRSGVLTTEGNNIVRADYDGGVLKGNNVEPSATNLVLRSEEFDNAYWGKLNSTVTPNDTVAPDGEPTADKLIPTAVAGGHNVFRSFSFVSGTTYSFMVFAKPDEEEWLRFTLASSIFGSAGVVVNLSTLATNFNSTDNLKIRQLPNGWVQVSFSKTATSTGSGNLDIGVGETFTFTGDGTSGLFIWGAQLETGSVATSYIKTTASTATRNADNISKTGISSEIGQTEGAVLVEVDVNDTATGAERVLFSIDTGAIFDSARLSITSTGNLQYRISNTTDGGINVVVVSQGSYPTGVVSFFATYKSGNYRLYANGVLIGSSSSSRYPEGTLSRIGLGNFNGISLFNDHIRSATIFDKALPEATAIRLTT